MKFQFTSKLLLGLTLVLSIAMAGRVIRHGMDLRDRLRMQNLIDALPGTSFNFRTADGKALTDVVTVPTGTLYCVISRNADTRLPT